MPKFDQKTEWYLAAQMPVIGPTKAFRNFGLSGRGDSNDEGAGI